MTVRNMVQSALVLLLMSGSVHATSTGALLGVFGGNDSVQSLFDDAGLNVNFLARVNLPQDVTEDSYSSDGLTLGAFELNGETPNEALAGSWFYDGGLVDYIVVKADGFYAIYDYTPGASEGKWTVADINIGGTNFAVSHVTAYSVVPLPAAVWLFASGLIGLGLTRRRKS